MAKKSKSTIPCEICGKVPTHLHHTLRDEPPYNEPDERLSQLVRNRSQHVQYLCHEHHLSEGHELFEPTKWPEGFGTIDRPFRIGQPEVDALIREAKAMRSHTVSVQPVNP